MPGAGSQLQQNFADAAVLLPRLDGFHMRPVSTLSDHFQQHGRHVFHSQDVGGVAGVDGAARHAVILGGGRFLHHADAAAAENGPQSQRAVGGRAGEDDADGALGLIFGQ